MAVLTQATARKRRSLHLQEFGSGTVATSTTIYQGALVAYNETTGRITNASAATGLTFKGVAEETKSGGQTIKFSFGHQEKLIDAAALTAGYTGCNVAVSDNDTVTTLSDAGTAAVRLVVGEMDEHDGTDAWVWVRKFAYKDAP